MIRHMVTWSLIPTDDTVTRTAQLEEIRRQLQDMVGKAPGLLSMQVYIRPLESSNAQLALISDFTDKEALAAYQIWPPHAELARTLIRPIADSRLCMDVEIPDAE